MEYVFGTNGPIEVLKTKGDYHTDFAGFRQVEQDYPDQTITDSFRIVRKLKSAEDVEGNCYDWYEIDRHYRTVDKTGPLRQEIAAVQQQTENASAMSTQLRTAARLYVQQAADIPDNTALEMPDLFKTWDEVLAAGAQLEANTILNDGGHLYRVVQAVTPQEGQSPHDDGMLAVYRPIDKQHAGTLEDPIPYVDGMDTEKDKYYSYNGKTYLCNLAMTPCVWAPDTAGLWQWTEVS